MFGALKHDNIRIFHEHHLKGNFLCFWWEEYVAEYQRTQMPATVTWQEQTKIVRRPRPQLTPPLPHQRLHRLQVTPVVWCVESRYHCSAGTAVGVPRATITTLGSKGTFMKAGAAVPLASAAQARAIHHLLYGHAVRLHFCRPVIPSSCQIVLTRHPRDNKLSTQARNNSSVCSWVSLHPTPNSFLPWEASLVRTSL